MENELTQNKIDTEALKKELEGYIEIAKKEKSKIEELGVGILTKSQEIELYHTNFVELRTKLQDGSTGLDALYSQATNFKNQVEQVNVSAQTALTQITEKVATTNIKITDIETYFGTFTELKSKLGDGQTGLQALLTQATTLKNGIIQVEVAAQESLKKINTQSISITTKIQEIEDYYTKTFLPIKALVDNPKTGIQATLNVVTDIKNEIVKTKSVTEERRNEIQILTEKSGDLKRQAEESLQEIEAVKTKSNEFKDSIGETLELVTSSSLTDSFVKRRDKIAKNVTFWRWSMLASIILLGASVLYIYYLQNKAPGGFQDLQGWYRYLFTSPLIYLVYLSSHNYNIERDYEERYAFKTVISTSLQAYIKLLSDKFSDKKEDLLSFTLSSIDKVYKEPYGDKDKSRKFSLGNKIVNVSLEDIETLVKQKENLEESLKLEKLKKEA